MALLNYLLTDITVFLGLGAGIALAYIAPEELKDGKRYFILLQNLLLSLIMFFLLYFYKFSLALRIAVSLALLFSLLFFLNNSKNSKIKYIDYGFLGVVFYLGAFNASLFLLLSALIFIYGLPSGSLLVDIKKRNILGVILKNSSFVVIALALLLI